MSLESVENLLDFDEDIVRGRQSNNRRALVLIIFDHGLRMFMEGSQTFLDGFFIFIYTT